VKLLAALALICASLTLFAAWSMEHGNRTGINGVIGGGICTAFLACCWWLSRN
jgi:hypothetical protein